MKACFFEPLVTPLAQIRFYLGRTHSPTLRDTEEPPVGGQDDTHGEEGTLFATQTDDASARVLRSFHTNNRKKTAFLP